MTRGKQSLRQWQAAEGFKDRGWESFVGLGPTMLKREGTNHREVVGLIKAFPQRQCYQRKHALEHEYRPEEPQSGGELQHEVRNG